MKNHRHPSDFATLEVKEVESLLQRRRTCKEDRDSSTESESDAIENDLQDGHLAGEENVPGDNQGGEADDNDVFLDASDIALDTDEMPFTYRASDLPRLDIQLDRGSDFDAWKEEWESYKLLSKLDKEEAAVQVATLNHCLSRETKMILSNLGLTNDEKKDVAVIIQKLTTFVKGEINESFERRNFRERTQADGESFAEFVIAIRELAKTCNFYDDGCTAKNLCDQIISGTADDEARKAMLREKGLTLTKAEEIARSHESSTLKSEIVGKTREKFDSVSINKAQKSTYKKQARDHTSKPEKTREHKYHAERNREAAATARKCYNCGDPNHFRRNCPKKSSKTLKQVSSRREFDSDSDEYGEELNSVRFFGATDNKSAPRVDVKVSKGDKSTTVTALPDSGADISGASWALLDQMGICSSRLRKSKTKPTAVNGTKMTSMGKIKVNITLGEWTVQETVDIFNELDEFIISWSACKALGILPESYPYPGNFAHRSRVESGIPVCEQKLSCRSGDNVNGARRMRGAAKDGGKAESDADKLIREFPRVFDGKIRAMEGESFKIHLKEEATPFCIRTPRKVPIPLQPKMKEQLDELQAQDAIKPVTGPAVWCAGVVMVPKKDIDDWRLCIDYSGLNKNIKREGYMSPTPAEAVADISESEAKIFTTFDCLKGYHQIPVDPDSQHLTRFITPWGQYESTRAPMGVSSISEFYNRRMDEAFEGLKGFRKIVDDVVVFDGNVENHFKHVREFVKRCDERGISLNKKKFKYGLGEAKFAGFQVSKDGYKLDEEIFTAIRNFPKPTNITDMRSFFGLANQIGGASKKVAEALKPLGDLLSPRNMFVWTCDHENAFEEAKKLLSSAPILAFFDPNKPTIVSSDASRLHGLGFTVQQRNADGSLSLIQAGSRFLRDAETRYATIELELLGIEYAIKKSSMFLAGLPHFDVQTDHAPLVPILNSKRLDEIENPRLQRIRMKLMRYHFTATWVKGSTHYAADALSRAPIGSREEVENPRISYFSFHHVRMAKVDGESLNLKLREVEKASREDLVYQELKRQIMVGFPHAKADLPEILHPFWAHRAELTIAEDGLVVHGVRLLVPKSMRRATVKQLHQSHAGKKTTNKRAAATLFWPNMENDIANAVASCQHCQDHLPSQQKQPYQERPPPERPFQEVALDIGQHGGQYFLILVDVFSGWTSSGMLGKEMKTTKVIRKIRNYFVNTGVPDIIWSDGGPQFTSSAFKDFARDWKIEHRLSSPHFPQSNGQAEAAVKKCKRIIKANWGDEDGLAKAMILSRNTPRTKDGLSPAEILFGKPVQDFLPAHKRALTPELRGKFVEAERKRLEAKKYSVQHYNKTARRLDDIGVGAKVAIQCHVKKTWTIYGTVVKTEERKLWIKTASGRVLIRNRVHVRGRIPTSLPEMAKPRPVALAQGGDDIPGLGQQLSCPPRRSTRPKKAPNRLITEME